MKLYLTLIVGATSFLLANEPNAVDFLNEDGSIDIPVLIAYLNAKSPEEGQSATASVPETAEPNSVLPQTAAAVTESANTAKCFEMPFLQQWLKTGNTTKVFYPQENRHIDGAGGPIEWHFINGAWVPKVAEQSSPVLEIYTRAFANKAIISFQDNFGVLWTLEIVGEFRINGTKTMPLSCDVNKDNIVNLHEFADFARRYKLN